MTLLPRTPDWSALLTLSVDRDHEQSLFRQLYNEMRRVILSGAVTPGSRLPATRHLAQMLGVSRMLVVGVYEQLVAEGYAEGRTGAGTFVSGDMLEPLAAPKPSVAESAMAASRPSPARRYAALTPNPAQFSALPFNTGRCSLDERTLKIWRSLTAAQLRHVDPQWLGYSDPRGALPLRAAVARYLRASRGVKCDAAQIMIVSGTQQAIDLVLKVLIEPGDTVWIEDPVYHAMHAALKAAQANIVPVPVDGQGMIVSAGIAASPAARAVYVTPSDQSPSGVVLSMARRQELLAWAREARSWVIEDDYNSEFRYAGRPLASLQGIDQGERVIYLGTFSKVLFPGLRLGYVVVPPELHDAMMAARFLTDRHGPGITEGVMTEFIEQGHLGAHIRRMCSFYRRARDELTAELNARLGDYLTVAPPDQGMHLTAHLRPGLSDVAIAEAAAQRGVVVRPLSGFYVAAPPVSALMLGFTGFDLPTLHRAAEALVGVFEGCG